MKPLAAILELRTAVSFVVAKLSEGYYISPGKQAEMVSTLQQVLEATEVVESNVTVEQVRRVLREVEWSGDAHRNVCPCCEAFDKHSPGCKLAQALEG